MINQQVLTMSNSKEIRWDFFVIYIFFYCFLNVNHQVNFRSINAHDEPRCRTTQLSQNFITINNTKSPDTVIKIIPDIIILKAFLFVFLHFSKINGHKMDKRRADINFHLTISTRAAPQNVSTQATAWFNCAVTPTVTKYAHFWLCT
jgi:hypothetical protein